MQAKKIHCTLYEGLNFDEKLVDLMKKLDLSSFDKWTASSSNPKPDDYGCYNGHSFTIKYEKSFDKSWLKYAGYMEVNHTKSYKPQYDVDTRTYQMREYKEEENKPKYTIYGPLVDPIVTESISRMVSHIEEQIQKITKRLKFQKDIETCSSISQRIKKDRNPIPSYIHDGVVEVEDINESLPVSQGGVGKSSISRMAKIYGVCTNIIQDEHIKGPTSAYGHSPNEKQMKKNVVDAIDLYNILSEEGYLRTDMNVEEFTKYPKNNPVSGFEDENTVLSPIGCKNGSINETDFETKIDNITIKATKGGYWKFNAENKPCITVPLGTENRELKKIKQDYYSSYTDTVIRILKDISKYWECEEMKNKDIQNYLKYSKTGYTKPVSDGCRDDSLSYLVRNIPENILGDEWSNYVNYSEIVFKYKHVQGHTTFTKTTGKITVEVTSDDKYIISYLENTFEANSYSKVIQILKDKTNLVQKISKQNIEFEKKYYENNDEDKILSSLSGISNGGESTLAKKYHTYTELFFHDDIHQKLTHHFKGDSKTIHDKIRIS